MKSESGRRMPLWVEAPSAVALALMSVLEGYRSAGDTLADPAPWVAVIASVAALGRHRYPRAAAGAALVSAVLGALLPLLVTLYHLSSRGRLREVWVCLGIVLTAGLPWLAVALTRGEPLTGGRLSNWTNTSFGNSVLIGLALALGMWLGSRRRLLEALTDQVEQLRVERELRAEQARLAERSRIAREMHDVLAHRLSLLMLHAGVLQLRGEGMPPATVERIALLRSTAGQALDDLREVLGAMRSDDGPRGTDGTAGAAGAAGTAGADGTVAVAAPALQDLAELLAEARAAGQLIESTVSGDAGSTSTTHRLAVHRLVREALTNARKHAYAAPVAVRVHYGPPATTVEVVNGPAGEALPASEDPGARTPGGYGLIGLAERVAALGGHLHTGATAGGWRLSARLPVASADLSADLSSAAS
ncbi:histidine kinase [Streptomyces sp. L-9-10]|uniref:sensor histidine kinase n=1 Tax=Streptomyces sp. L-9-10 TaxID=1478131 RepID=UPI001F00C7A9|nr:histidine kinase [Streptomyces sp. L-9-10]